MPRLRTFVSSLFLPAALVGVATAHAGVGSPEFDNELTVWVMPAPRPAELSWRTPGALIRTVVTNAVGEMMHVMGRKLGHMGVTLRCAATPTAPAFTWQGSMKGSNKAEFQDIVVKQGYGLGVLFHRFSGRLETAAEMQESIDQRYRTGRISWVRVGVSAPTCRRLVSWLGEMQRAGVDKYYGLAANPRLREGAGCSAFSMSFMEQGGFLERAYTPWSFDLRAPMSLIGGPETGRKISLARGLAVTRGWAKPNEPGKRIFGWDPTQAFHWLKRAAPLVRWGKPVFSTPALVERRKNAVGIVLDRRSVPTPTEAFFKN